jgi:amino acid transporter
VAPTDAYLRFVDALATALLLGLIWVALLTILHAREGRRNDRAFDVGAAIGVSLLLAYIIGRLWSFI